MFNSVWWTKDPPYWLFLLLLPLVILAHLSVAVFGDYLVHVTGGDHSLPNTFRNAQALGTNPVVTFLYGAIFAPLNEEFGFRAMPFLILRRYSKRGISSRGILLTMILSSAIFGVAHGSLYNVFIQGFSGIIYSLLLLKWSGRLRSIWKGTLVTFTAHAAFNGLALFMLLFVVK